MISTEDVRKIEALYAIGQKVDAIWQARELALQFLPGHQKRLQAYIGTSGPDSFQLPRDATYIEEHFYSQPELYGEPRPENEPAAEVLTHCARWMENTPSRRASSHNSRDDHAYDAFLVLRHLATMSEPEATQPRMKAQVRQGEEILETLRALGHNPLALPVSERGFPGVKAEVRSVLRQKKGYWLGTTVFDKAWQRLRELGELADKAP